MERLRKLSADAFDEDDNSDGLTLTEHRVEVIIDYMADGEWVSGVTDRNLAQLWNLSRVRVQNLAAEANRVFRRLQREDDEHRRGLLSRVCQSFERLAYKAESEGSVRGLAVAGEQLERMARFNGLEPPRQLVVQRKGRFDDWTVEELTSFNKTGVMPERHRPPTGVAQ